MEAKPIIQLTKGIRGYDFGPVYFFLRFFYASAELNLSATIAATATLNTLFVIIW